MQKLYCEFSNHSFLFNLVEEYSVLANTYGVDACSCVFYRLKDLTKYQPYYSRISYSVVTKGQVTYLLDNLLPTLPISNVTVMIPGTEGQIQSPARAAHRRVIFTASEAKAVLALKPESWLIN